MIGLQAVVGGRLGWAERGWAEQGGAYRGWERRRQRMGEAVHNRESESIDDHLLQHMLVNCRARVAGR